jgi:hypothetical protein
MTIRVNLPVCHQNHRISAARSRSPPNGRAATGDKMYAPITREFVEISASPVPTRTYNPLVNAFQISLMLTTKARSRKPRVLPLNRHWVQKALGSQRYSLAV